MLLPISIPGFTYQSDFLSPAQADWLFTYCHSNIAWQSYSIQLYGRTHLQPRLSYWMADRGVTYAYSGLTLYSAEWLSPIARLRDLISERSQQRFNAVLLNYYRDGNDSMGWHSDDEESLGQHPTIASVSLGADRDFQIREKPNRDSKASTPIKASLSLGHGSLLLMSGNSQHDFQHALPKRKRVAQPRINLTFRYVYAT